MKKYSKSNYQKKVAIRSAIVIAIIGGLVGTGFYGLNAYQSIGHFAYENPPDPSTFLEPDLDLLAEVAYGLDYRFAQYHLPLNQTSTTTFNNDSLWNGGQISYNNVSYYHFSDNEALFTGISYAGVTYKYLTAIQENNETMKQFAYDVLINMTTGLSLLMAVPNGGIGPEFGGVLARGVCPRSLDHIWPGIFEPHPKHFNGTGAYSDWGYRAYTSNDEFGGYYLFLSLATRYLQDIPFVYDRVSKIVDQLCTNMLANNFLGIHGTGALTGVDQKPRMFTGGFWTPLLLKLGSIYYPEKYSQKYTHYVSNELVYLSASEGGAQETFANYYAYNFGLCVCLAFLIIEDSSTEIWQVYFEGFLQSMWHFVRYHRNMWANVIFLMICKENNILESQTDDNFTTVSNDVADQLQRFAQNRVPDLYYDVSNELPEGYEIITPVKDFAQSLGLSEDVQKFMGIDGEEQFLNKPLSIEYREPRQWMWSGNPYSWNPKDRENILTEFPGHSFFVPYWMMRYMGYLGGGEL